MFFPIEISLEGAGRLGKLCRIPSWFQERFFLERYPVALSKGLYTPTSCIRVRPRVTTTNSERGLPYWG